MTEIHLKVASFDQNHSRYTLGARTYYVGTRHEQQCYVHSKQDATKKWITCIEYLIFEAFLPTRI